MSPRVPPASGCAPTNPTRVLGLGWGAARWGPAARRLGWWPRSFLPAVPPALPAGSHLPPLPRLYELASPLAPGCTAAACLSLPIAFKNPLAPSRGCGAAQRRARLGRQPGSGAGKVPVPLGGASRGAPDPSRGACRRRLPAAARLGSARLQAHGLNPESLPELEMGDEPRALRIPPLHCAVPWPRWQQGFGDATAVPGSG